VTANLFTLSNQANLQELLYDVVPPLDAPQPSEEVSPVEYQAEDLAQIPLQFSSSYVQDQEPTAQESSASAASSSREFDSSAQFFMPLEIHC